MLLVKTRLGKSPIHGIGLFAAEPIERGREVWQFSPGFDLDLDPQVLASVPPDQREKLLHYGYIDRRLNRFILCADDTRFVNHSDDPNIALDFSRDRYGVDVALRDIADGEEITTDYRTLED